jgi:flavin reductase (DIM6/NTAB) family NADH-FMN oxidoreductase RutF
MRPRPDFVTLSRQQFRRYFQPSRILLCVMPAPNESGVNIITVCFSMYCSYRPPMLGIAIQNINASYRLIQDIDEYVLSVPGPTLACETLYCGINSMKTVDKVKEMRIELLPSERVTVPGLKSAVANIEMVKQQCILTGDHVLVVGRAVRFAVNRASVALPLLSIGPDTSGYSVLAQKGIHRIGTVRPR